MDKIWHFLPPNPFFQSFVLKLWFVVWATLSLMCYFFLFCKSYNRIIQSRHWRRWSFSSCVIHVNDFRNAVNTDNTMQPSWPIIGLVSMCFIFGHRKFSAQNQEFSLSRNISITKTAQLEQNIVILQAKNAGSDEKLGIVVMCPGSTYKNYFLHFLWLS